MKVDVEIVGLSPKQTPTNLWEIWVLIDNLVAHRLLQTESEDRFTYYKDYLNENLAAIIEGIAARKSDLKPPGMSSSGSWAGM